METGITKLKGLRKVLTEGIRISPDPLIRLPTIEPII